MPREMEKESSKNRSLNRRRFLGAACATSSAALTSGFLRPNPEEKFEIDDFLDSENLKDLLEKVGNPEVKDQNSEVYEGRNLKLASANLDTEVGTVKFLEVLESNIGKFDQGDTSLKFKVENLTGETRRSLPTRVNSIPAGVDFTLRNKGNRTSLTTTVTRSEQVQLSKLVGSENFTALYVNDHYYVKTGESETYYVTGEIERPKINNASVEKAVTTQVDAEACFNCGVNAPGCVGNCLTPCLPEHGNPIDCATCIGKHCVGLDVKSCTKCIASIPEDLL
ncbi:twin-arginine translocation signal domain-containing protein [Halorussus pelagicus]|uniref:twin-arginine translocation signal domain-containing protein n=1 Tax=Halorussus pelagicus TaxID=2505977 RepID=UPI000FFCC2C9|nr:twin-arginine translocation signal domain-containing protein [Halorussus pelagicus]